MRLFFISSIIIISTAVSLHAETATVITKQTAIRESCRFFSPVKATVHYDDVLEIISKEGDWYRVQFKGFQGCIHKSSIEKSSISLSNVVGSEKQSTSGDEVALAGKGFNPQVEAAYKKENPSLNFQAVDRVENYKVLESKLIQFIQSGKLNLQ
ncbi:MAG TPA: hypothetical protein VFF49_05430 [Thermodesulfobacteriota bacterium]|nr:hypothetical protein [Thermodesulfobacteriota bacterium]